MYRFYSGILFCFLTACSQDDATTAQSASPQTQAAGSVTDVGDERIRDADSEPQNWLTHGRDYGEQRHSPLKRIHDGNAGRLGLAWYKEFPTRRGLEATPLVVDGVMYTTGPWNRVYAFNAANGKQLWEYDPQVPPERLRFACCGISNRGVAVWQGKVYEATLDGRLIALSAATGEPVWEVQTTPPKEPYSITGAPRVVNGKVVIGNSGSEFGIRGYVTAYDAETGEQVWRFYTVPGNPADGFESPAMEMAAQTWSGEWWQYGGGGTAWDAFAFDPELDRLYIGIGNGGPWSRHARSEGRGDNLFLSSIVAVNADTGEYVWHYQTTPGDSWDYTATQPMILADLMIDGEERKVLMQAPKNGFFYVLDRETGELISAENIVPVNWAGHIDMATGRPVIPEENYYEDGPVWIRPGPIGAHNWKSMSWHPGTGLVYIPVLETFFIYGHDEEFDFVDGLWNLGQDPALITPGEPLPEPPDWPTSAHLAAWDPVVQEERWRIPREGLWNGGVLTTAGNLLIQGASNGNFYVYRADNGEELWSMPVQTGIIAAPITYEVDGEQYIAVNAGWGGTWSLIMGAKPAMDEPLANDRLLVFKLDGQAELPPSPEAGPDLPKPPPLQASQEQVSKGAVLYNEICYVCHGFNAHSGGTIPDLRYMSPESHDLFREIVLDGILSANGMVSFADVLSEEDVEAIHAYIISRANEDWKKQQTDQE